MGIPAAERGPRTKLPRRISDSAAIVHPGEHERPFRTDETEPDWLRDELAPPALECEQREPETPPAALPLVVWAPVTPAG